MYLESIWADRCARFVEPRRGSRPVRPGNRLLWRWNPTTSTIPRMVRPIKHQTAHEVVADIAARPRNVLDVTRRLTGRRPSPQPLPVA
jgi:hypothetical protein